MGEKRSNIDVVIKNSFFLWTNIIILFLVATPVLSFLIGKIFHIQEWYLPKTYELKIYAFVMLLCLGIPWLNKYFSTLLQYEHPRYRMYMLLYYPIGILLYTFIPTDIVRYSVVFILSTIGVLILYCDIYNKMLGTSVKMLECFDKNYNLLLLISVCLSIIFIISKSTNISSDLFSLWGIGLFIVIYSMFHIFKLKQRVVKWFALILPCLLVFITWYSMPSMLDISAQESAVYHHNFFFGPVIEMLYGGKHPLMSNNQYGGGLITFLALYFKLHPPISMEHMSQLLKFLTVIQYLIVYAVARSLYYSRIVAVLALAAILIFNFYTQYDFYYGYPSIAVLRFGLIYLVLLCYLLEDKWLSKQNVLFFISILGSIAFIWSFESAIYTLPAIFFTEYMNRNMKKFLPIFFATFFVIILLYLSPFIFNGTWPPLDRYYEYSMIYANGFGQVPLIRTADFWWLFPLLYGVMLIRIVLGYTNNKLVIILTIYGMAIFTYYGGRACPNNLFHISIPFVLLSFYFIQTLKSQSLQVKQILFACATVVFSSAAFQCGFTGGIVLKNVVKQYISFKPEPSPRNMEYINCSIYAPLQKYIENGALPLLTENAHSYQLYVCMQAHNAFSANPYDLNALSPKTRQRTISALKDIKNRYLLIDSNLLEKQSDSLVPQILDKMEAQKIDTIKLGNSTIVVFRTNVGTRKNLDSARSQNP